MPDASYILKTFNSGSTWSISYTGNCCLSSLHFVNDSIGYAVGLGGEIEKTILDNEQLSGGVYTYELNRREQSMVEGVYLLKLIVNGSVSAKRIVLMNK